MEHLHAAGRLAVLHDLLELGAHKANLGDNAVDGHKLVQVMAAQGPWVEQLKQGAGETVLIVISAKARRAHAFPFDLRTPHAACATLCPWSQLTSNS